MVEVGPGRTMSGMVEREVGVEVEVISVNRRGIGEGGEEEIEEAIGKIWAAGSKVEWEEGYAGERRRREELPTYPFERKRYWIETSKTNQNDNAQKKPGHGIHHNGNGNGSSASENLYEMQGNERDRALEQLLAKQLELMSRQLELLRDEDLRQPS